MTAPAVYLVCFTFKVTCLGQQTDFKSPTCPHTYPHLNFMAKKRKISGLSGADLVLTIESIEKLQRSLIYEESETEEGETDDLEGGLADVLSLLKARVGGTKVGTRSAHHPSLLRFCSPSLSLA